MSTNHNTHHALVLGASMAGLLTTRVLSNHFDRVTIVERDPVHDQPESRKGQPQTRHLHGLLANGLATMTRYFPDLPAALVEHGAIVGDMEPDGPSHHVAGVACEPRLAHSQDRAAERAVETAPTPA